MKKNLRSACSLFLVFLFFTVGFVGLGNAEKVNNSSKQNYTFNESNYSHHWDGLSSPTSNYTIWGYPGKTYNFTTKYNSSLFSNNSTMVFYWDCKGEKSAYTPVEMSNYTHHSSKDSTTNCSNCTHIWNKTGTYYVSVGVFKQDGTPINVSYWVPVEIRNNTYITVQNLSMMDEKEGLDSNNSAHIYKISNFSEIILGEKEGFNCSNSTYNVSSLENSSKKCCYCGYKDNDYSFSTCLNATCGKNETGKSENIQALPDIRTPTKADIQSLSETDTRTIEETTTEIMWGDTFYDNNIFGNIPYSNETEDALVVSNNVSIKSDNINTSYIQWNENFTHEWDGTGIKTINATSFHWDPLDGSENYSNYINKSILIISDPKNLAPYPLIGNLQNWGILLSILGLVIFYFTYTRNNVPIKIALFGMKPFYLKSVNSLTGTLTFVAGMYLCFVFGRCPWDIPIVSSSNWLSNMYFNMLYHEYVTKPLFDIPYLSILIGLLDVIILSLIIHLIAIPFYKGEFKIGESLRKKISSTSAQPEMISYSVENKTNQEN